MKTFRTNLILAVLFLFPAIGMWGMSSSEKDITITTSSQDAMQLVRQGLAMMDQGDHQKAKDLFTQAIQKDPKLSVAYLFKANEAMSPKEFAEDLRMASINIDNASQWEKWYYDYYQTFLTRDWNKRLEIAKKIARTYPDAPRPQVDLGNTYSEASDITHARESYQKAIQLDPNWTGGYMALCMSYLFYEPRDASMAQQYAQKATELAPQSQGTEIALGDSYRAMNDLAKAKDAYSKAISLDPTTSEAYYKRGHANTFLGNYDEAKKDYEMGGRHDESMAMSNQFTGLTYLYSGDFKTAYQYFNDLASKADASGESPDKIRTAKMAYYECLADIAFHHNDVDKLREVIGMMDPLSTQIAQDVGTKEASLVQKSNILYWQSLMETLEGNYKEAVSRASEIKTTLSPLNNPTKLQNYEFAMGFINLKQDHYAEAVSHFEKADQNNIYTKYWLAKAYDMQGDKDKANDLYKQVSVYNFNDDGYALVRTEVNEKLAMGGEK